MAAMRWWCCIGRDHGKTRCGGWRKRVSRQHPFCAATVAAGNLIGWDHVVAAPAGRDESDGRKSANPDMPDLIKRLAQSLKIFPPLCIVQDCHSPSIVPGLRAIPHLAIYRPGDPVAGRDLNPVSMLILRWRPRFKAGGLGFVPADHISTKS
jgi:hypothetical protein